ncbi:unnamed protein product [Cylindrotheca closterium]|uniref:Fungal lipase-type domain-containing protein n=1 Tax=Cylindrotheca closterium TaxID=2856 RepID=A0AAD2G6N7_9STRA|nr:unnamed protein product [Cylindrotheca closterium]
MSSYKTSVSTNKVAAAAAKTLDGRLLCASSLAYGIREPYLSGAGFLSPPLQITKGVNSCLIGRTRDGIVIAFRAGGFHRDALYNNNNKGLAREVRKALQEVLSTCDTKSKYKSTRRCKLYLTGHSKGGCLASLFALELLQSPDLPNPEYVCTFGAPRVGDAEFGSYYQEHVLQTAYENHLDMIPFFPPSSRDSPKMTSLMEDLQKDECQTSKSCSTTGHTTKTWEYAPIGTRKFISRQGEIVHHVSRQLDNQRIREIEGKTILRLGEFRQAHCSSCPDTSGGCSGGYFKAIAPEICASAYV